MTFFIAAYPVSGSPPPPLQLPIKAQRGDEAGRIWTLLEGGSVLISENEAVLQNPFGIVLPLDDDWPERLAAADRLQRALSGKSHAAPLTRQRHQRIARALRSADALQDGASYRALAIALFGARRVQSEPWKTSSLKAQIIRLTRYGRTLIETGFRHLIRRK